MTSSLKREYKKMKKLVTLIALCTVVCATTLMSPVSASTASDYGPNMGAYLGVTTKSVEERLLDAVSSACSEYGWKAYGSKWNEVTSPSGLGMIRVRQVTLVDEADKPRFEYTQRVYTEAYEYADITTTHLVDENDAVVTPEMIRQTIAQLAANAANELEFKARIDFLNGTKPYCSTTHKNVGAEGGILYITEYSADEKLVNVYSTRVADNGGIVFPLNHNTARVRVMLLDPHGISITEPIRLNIRNRITAN